jgi:murein DD-endopeptidase MepM/ murein hydrolase activator NlpD
MPWGCSERRRLGALLIGAGLLGAIGASAAAHARSPWALGVFPVRQFQAYTSHYGTRVRPGGREEPHYGLDIAAPLGSPIHSWWGGVVQEVINDGACGIGLVIRSGAYEHIYCHLAGLGASGRYQSGPVLLRSGETVRTGQLIGHVGLSGRTTGPHLHWGMRYRGQWLDPARILRAMAEGQRRLRATARAPKAPSAPRVASFR